MPMQQVAVTPLHAVRLARATELTSKHAEGGGFPSAVQACKTGTEDVTALRQVSGLPIAARCTASAI